MIHPGYKSTFISTIPLTASLNILLYVNVTIFIFSMYDIVYTHSYISIYVYFMILVDTLKKLSSEVLLVFFLEELFMTSNSFILD